MRAPEEKADCCCSFGQSVTVYDSETGEKFLGFTKCLPAALDLGYHCTEPRQPFCCRWRSDDEVAE